MAKNKTLKQIYLAWMLQYEKVERLKASLKKAKRYMKILKATMVNMESEGKKIN